MLNNHLKKATIASIGVGVIVGRGIGCGVTGGTTTGGTGAGGVGVGGVTTGGTGGVSTGGVGTEIGGICEVLGGDTTTGL